MQNARFFIAATMAVALFATAAPATAAGVAPSAATSAQREQAQSHFLRGKDFYTQGKYDVALAEFSASLDVVNSPNTRLYVGRCLREMGKTVQAYVELGRTAAEAKELARNDARYNKAATAAADERAQLEPKIGFVAVTVNHPGSSTTLKVAGDDIPRNAWNEPVPVLAGSNEIVVETPGHDPVKRTVNVTSGSNEPVSIDAGAEKSGGAVATTPAPTTTTPEHKPSSGGGTNLKPYAYIAAGVGFVGLATFAAFGLLANGTYSDLQQECGGEKACPPGHKDEISRGKTQQTIANVGLVFFLIGGASAVTLFVLSKPSGDATARANATRVVARGSSLGLEGSF